MKMRGRNDTTRIAINIMEQVKDLIYLDCRISGIEAHKD
jgi:hypothetical protein